MREWRIYQSDDEVHSIPLQDLCIHVLGKDCVCDPVVEQRFRDLVLHNSWDERETKGKDERRQTKQTFQFN